MAMDKYEKRPVLVDDKYYKLLMILKLKTSASSVFSVLKKMIDYYIANNPDAALNGYKTLNDFIEKESDNIKGAVFNELRKDETVIMGTVREGQDGDRPHMPHMVPLKPRARGSSPGQPVQEPHGDTMAMAPHGQEPVANSNISGQDQAGDEKPKKKKGGSKGVFRKDNKSSINLKK